MSPQLHDATQNTPQNTMKTTINGKELEITATQVWDATDGWEVTEISVNGHPHGQFDGYDGYAPFTSDRRDEDLIGFIEQNFSHGGWDNLKEAQDDALLAQFIEDHGDEWVLLCNSYESDTDRGFANTFSLDFSEEGETSSHGWNEAVKLSDLDSETWREEILALAKSEEQ